MIVTVNGRGIGAEEVLRDALLDGGPTGLLGPLIDRELLRQHASAIGITVGDEELQRAADEMRHERGLEGADRAMEWLRAHHQTVASAQRSLEALLVRNKVMSGIAADEVRAYFHTHRIELESVVLFSIRVASDEEAWAIRRQVEAGSQFSALAASASLDPATRAHGGFVGRLRRREMSPEIAEAVLSVAPGSLVGPIRTERGYNLFLVADRRQPTLDEEEAAIRLLLFEELLARLRSAADIRYPPLEAESA
jgi:parvulin-like peptidyl-prolyl isomerase